MSAQDKITETSLAGGLTLRVGAILGGLAVALGAFGAHSLESLLAAEDSAEQVRLLATWETAARYHMYHALALLVAGLMARRGWSRGLRAAATCFLVGTLIFSGCLYTYVLSGVRVLGAIVPLGGVTLIVGWALLAWSSSGLRAES